MSWVRVTRRQPCPICQHPDWCSIATEGDLICCMRVESPYPCKGEAGGWFHGEDARRLFDPDRREQDHVYVLPVKPKPEGPAPDFAKLACEYVEKLININMIATELGISIRSLERLQIGWSGNGYSFPMRSGTEKIIGIRIRGRKGKWCVPGSHNGLFWPEGVYRGGDYPIMVCEGETDVAALLDLGFDAIGRPSCSGGVEHVAEFLKGRRRDVVIVADNDKPHERPDGSVWFPGQEGARRLAQGIKPLARTLKIIKPPFYKDVRDWVRAGATRDMVEAVIANTKFFVPERSLRASARAGAVPPPAALPEPTGTTRRMSA